MESVIRAAAVYLFLLLVFRLGGQRTLAQITTFDFVLLLIISEAIQQALIGEDSSITNAVLIVLTLAATNVGLSILKQRSKTAEKILEDVPLVIVSEGRMLHDRMDKVRVDADDILEAARESHGLERLDQIRCAVLERSGQISIIPNRGD